VTTEVVVSWRPGDPQREANLRWVLAKWATTGWPVTLNGADDGHGWCRANDVTPMVEASDADVIVVADADVWCEGIFDAVTAVEQGTPWAVPHLMLCRLSEQATANVLDGAPPEHQDDFAERPYKGHPAGTLFVIRRGVYLDCPLDPRFVNWGNEDDALSLALDLLHGKHWRGSEPCWHLFHQPQSRRSRGVGNQANLQLYRRYKSARSNPERMRALVDEGREVHHAGLHRVAVDGEPVPHR
jgi:hypothetical protein